MLDLKRAGLAVAALTVIAGPARAGLDEDAEIRKWEEAEVSWPALPEAADCTPFFVSAASANRFCVDLKSITVTADGVVRYSLVVETPSGGRNISFEGMRCDTRERRLYAVGRPDGTWSKARVGQWEKIREAAVNRQYATLFLEYFCPGGLIVATADEARSALRQGGHPSTKRSY